MALLPVILAGGAGTRLWPLSREFHPKQFLALTSKRSMIQETLARVDGMEDVSPAIVVCNESHRFLVAEHARQAGRTLSCIILEPEGRNTAPALTLAALWSADARGGSIAEDPVLLILPSDHVIRDVDAFQSAVQRGSELAETGCIVAIGIVPTSPATSYGYIKMGRPASSVEGAWTALGNPSTGTTPFLVSAFLEKPDKATAETMLGGGEHLWNSGILMVRASVWLQQLRRHRPDIAEICTVAHDKGKQDGDFYRPDPGVFASCPGDFVAYEIMKKISDDHKSGSTGVAAETSVCHRDCVVLPLDAGWSDVGAWSTLWEEGAQDAQGNVIQGDVYALSMSDSLVIGQHRLLATVGLENVIVVETADAVLVAHKDHVQDVKALVEQLKLEHRPEHENHRKVHRPWGSSETVDSGPRLQVKRLTLNPGAAFSMHMHQHRTEHWVVVKGTAKLSMRDEELLLTENQSTHAPSGSWHRLENPGATSLELIEVWSGSYLGEDDIVRVDDHS